MNKIIVAVIVTIFALTAWFFVGSKKTDVNQSSPSDNSVATTTETDMVASSSEDFKTAEFVIDGQKLKLGDSLGYFGGGIVADINNDGREDNIFLVTYSPGGTGTFFYAVAALQAETGYVGSDGYLLGDRIAPQTIELSQNPQHQDVIVVNYADRAPGESMVTPPSVGKSAYLKLDSETKQWGVVQADFEGEADPQAMSLLTKTWVWQSALYNDGREVLPKQSGVFTLTFAADNSFSVTTDCNNAGGNYTAGDSSLTFGPMFSTLMYCEDSQESEFLKLLENTGMYHFTSRGELILDLKFDSGIVTFR